MPFDPPIHREWLNTFLAWAAPHGIATRCPPTANPAGRLDIDTAQVIARITYWSSGECDAEILDVESEQRIYQCSWTNLQPGHFDTAFAQWLALVHGPTGQSPPP
ncbi:immunity protein TriTu family protein [Stenotrophomonas maltophilia]